MASIFSCAIKLCALAIRCFLSATVIGTIPAIIGCKSRMAFGKFASFVTSLTLAPKIRLLTPNVPAVSAVREMNFLLLNDIIINFNVF